MEPVSRTFTQLEQNGVIALPTSRRLELRTDCPGALCKNLG
ncbi:MULTISPECIES: hypothetical protein [Bradyrhizobium]|nr:MULTISPECIES: hypothetical protein [Bradyrhizobium]